jgi:surface antigen
MGTNHSFKRTLIAAALLMTLVACSSNQQSHQKTAEQIGTLAGAAIGYALGEDEIGASLGAIAGMVAGNLVGSLIGEHLDEVDKLKAEVAMLAALNESKNTKVTWKSDKNPGVKGEIQTKKVSKNGNNCKSVTQILIIDGEKTKEVNTLCRKSDGSWALS